MSLPSTPNIQLDRAYIESKVIEGNLRHVTVALALADGDLRDELQLFTQRFRKFVLRLGHASEVAAATEAAARHAQTPLAMQTRVI